MNRVCRWCGKPIIRKRMSTGDIERLNDFQTRKHCDNKCSSAFSADMKTTTEKRKETVRQNKIAAKQVPIVETDLQCPEHLLHILARRKISGAAWLFATE